MKQKLFRLRQHLDGVFLKRAGFELSTFKYEARKLEPGIYLCALTIRPSQRRWKAMNLDWQFLTGPDFFIPLSEHFSHLNFKFWLRKLITMDIVDDLCYISLQNQSKHLFQWWHFLVLSSSVLHHLCHRCIVILVIVASLSLLHHHCCCCINVVVASLALLHHRLCCCHCCHSLRKRTDRWKGRTAEKDGPWKRTDRGKGQTAE